MHSEQMRSVRESGVLRQGLSDRALEDAQEAVQEVVDRWGVLSFDSCCRDLVNIWQERRRRFVSLKSDTLMRLLIVSHHTF